jgi:hypothetical protein
MTVDALFDGTVLRPVEPLELEPNTHVRITIELVAPEVNKPRSFLETAKNLNLEGPSDWAANLDDYLYGETSPNSTADECGG